MGKSTFYNDKMMSFPVFYFLYKGGLKMASKVYECIAKIADSIIENKDYLTELDREIGDADHGINMARGYTEALGQLPQDETDIGAVLKKTGMVLLSKVGEPPDLSTAQPI